MSRLAKVKLTPQQYDLAQTGLDRHTNERAAFNQGRYQTSRRQASTQKNSLSRSDLPNYEGALARRITKERIRPGMQMKQGTYSAKNLATVLMGKNVERVTSNKAGDIFIKKGTFDTASKNGIQSFRPKVQAPSPSTSPEATAPPTTSNSAQGAPQAHGVDLISLYLQLGNLQSQLHDAGSKGDAQQAEKINYQIMMLNIQIREALGRAADQVLQEQRRMLKDISI